ncbi:hypothetical protein AGMMS50256_25880 [Betaproteobacteria bacterium]|nr:hypothetical protein AGMMS50256_25880 [Betaproteobacteria bacterium]
MWAGLGVAMPAGYGRQGWKVRGTAVGIRDQITGIRDQHPALTPAPLPLAGELERGRVGFDY